MDSAPIVKGLTDEEQSAFNSLFSVWRSKLSRNTKRIAYYDGKNRLKDLGISIPPQLKDIETVVGWPTKAVDSLAIRSVFDGFVFPSEGIDGRALTDVLSLNHFDVLYAQGTTSELIHSCSFITTSRGDESRGAPPVLISAYSAVNASALWDWRKKRIGCGMTIIDKETEKLGSTGDPTWINLYTDTHVIVMKEGTAGWVVAHRFNHLFGRPMMEPLVYKPSLDRPLGRSRITRAVMSITDSAVRTALRSEISAEFAASPQKYLLGADEDAFEKKTKWEAYIGTIFAASRDEEGQVPQFGQLAQGSMEPHTGYMRSLATRFAGETNIPVASLGVVQDNPSSAEAIYAAQEDLIVEAQTLNRMNGSSLENLGKMVFSILENTPPSKLPLDVRGIKANFMNPATPSIVSRADAMSKQISALPYLAETDVALEWMGYSQTEITRIKAQRRKQQALTALNTFADAEVEPEVDHVEPV